MSYLTGKSLQSLLEETVNRADGKGAVIVKDITKDGLRLLLHIGC